jgi:fumarate hydratase class II
MQGQFELNVRIPLIARNLLASIELLANASTLLAEKCVDGIEPNEEGLKRSAEGTLAVATALNPFIGYDKAAEIVKAASDSGGTLREVAREHGVDEETLDKALDLRKIAAGSKAEE